MARPQKNNADYFTHDADMRNDVRVKAVRRKFGHTGYAVWNYLLEVMTDSDFFEIDWSELNQELLSADFDLSVEELREIVDYCVRLELLQMENGKLFSAALQQRFSGLLSKRKRDAKRVSDSEKQDSEQSKGDDKELSAAKIENKRVIGGENSANGCENPQSKVKESKVNIIINSDNNTDTHPDGCSTVSHGKKKVENSKRFVPPNLHQIEDYCRERGSQVNATKFFNYYTSNGWRVGKNPMKDWKAAVRSWENNNYDNADQRRTGAGTPPPTNGNYVEDL